MADHYVICMLRFTKYLSKRDKQYTNAGHEGVQPGESYANWWDKRGDVQCGAHAERGHRGEVTAGTHR